MNATPNLINVEQIDLQRKKLEAETEILRNIEDYALLFSRIQEATTLEEFNRIVSEDAANDSNFNVASNDPLYNSNNINSEKEERKMSFGTTELELPKNEVNENEVNEKVEDLVSEEPSGPPKIKLNLNGFSRAANSGNDDEEQKAA